MTNTRVQNGGIPHDHYRRRWWTLGVLALSLVLVVMESSSLNVAIPTLVRELGVSDTELQWIVDLYTLVFGALLLPMGALGDRFGRKGALQAGLGIFGLASLATAALAHSGAAIIIGRGAMGVGAALVMPATLSILSAVFPPHERGKAIGIWAAFAGLGALFGQVSSGFLLEYFSWQSIFWIVIPIVLLALSAGIWLVPDSRDPAQAPLDIPGSLLSMLGLGGILFVIIEGPNIGWGSVPIITVAGVSLALVVLLVLWEKRCRYPMLPLEFFRDPLFSMGNLVVALVFLCMFSMFFVVTQYLQFIQGFSPLESGVRFLPLGFGVMLGAPNSARLAIRLGPARVIEFGLLVLAGSLASLAILEADDPYWQVGWTLFGAGLGMGLSMTPATTSIMASVPLFKAGIGSSMNDTSRQIGGALGIALLGTIMKSSYAEFVGDRLPGTLSAAQRALAETGLGRALTIAAGMGSEGDTVARVAREAFLQAAAFAFWIAVITALVSALIVSIWFPRTAGTFAASAYGTLHQRDLEGQAP